MMFMPKKIKTTVSPKNIIYNLEFEEVLKKNDLLDFDRVMSISETRIVKHVIPERKTETFSFEQEGEKVCAYLKRHPPLSFGKCFRKRIKFASKKNAFDEFINILAFHQAGLPTMIPVAAGKRVSKIFGSESFLITKEIKGCITLETYAESCFKTKTFTERKELIKKTALLSRKMHQSGFNHKDFYLCHLLIGIEENNKDDLFIVDLHRVDIRKKVPERWKIKDLAALNYSAESKNITRIDRLRFLKYYLSVNKISEQDKLFILKIIKKTNRMVKHAKRCFRENQYFTVVKNRDLKGYATLPLNRDVLRLMENPDKLFSDLASRILKEMSSASSLLFPSLAGSPGIYLKRYNVKSIFDVIKNIFRPSRGKKTWLASNILKARGIPTPEPILFMERKKSFFVFESYIVTEPLFEAEPLNFFMDSSFNRMSKKDKLKFIKEVAIQVKQLHDCGIMHRDLKATNILVNAGDKVKIYFTDLDAIKVSDSLLSAERAKDLARLNCSFLDTAFLPRGYRLYFLKSYLMQVKRKELKKYWDSVIHFTELKLKKSKREFN